MRSGSYDYSIIGKRYGYLTVLDFDHRDERRRTYWLCLCDCGNTKVVSRSNLTCGFTTSCGCHRYDHTNFDDITGRRFGRLEVIALDHKNESGEMFWKCRCDCGNETVVKRGNLISGNTSSCGCLKAELTRKRASTHGLSNSSLYSVWNGMLDRCRNKNSQSYERYGERGIHVCDEWLDFNTFYHWGIENGYDPSLSLDRIDNDGDYCPDNCRWADDITQANNKRNNRIVTYDGVTHTVAEWSRILDVGYKLLWKRINRGDFGDFEEYFGKCQKYDRNTNHLVTYNGETHSIAQWSRILDINYSLLWKRINRGDMRDFEEYFEE